MPTTRPTTFWPARLSLPQPALAGGASPVLPYATGKSRFTIRPLQLSLDQLLFIITAALLCVGLLMVQSSELRITSGTGHWFLQSLQNKNVFHAFLAIVAMTVMWRMDYRVLMGKSLFRSLPMALLALTALLLVLALTKFGANINGSKRWLMLPLGFTRISLQPSELAKSALVLFLSAYAVHRAKHVTKFFTGFMPMIAILGIIEVLIVKEDFGTGALIGIVCFALLMMSGCRWWHITLLVGPACAAAILAVTTSAYRMARITSFLNPELDPKGAGYHAIQSLLCYASGGFNGRGLGNGLQKMGYLPEGNTDFIFSVFCEETGFIGAAMVIGLFVGLTLIGWRIASRCKHPFGQLVAFGITAMIGLQAAINIAVVTVTVPTKGIALPLISSGGTGWIMTAAAIGILMSVERVNRHEAAAAEVPGGFTPKAMGFPVELKKPETAEAPKPA